MLRRGESLRLLEWVVWLFSKGSNVEDDPILLDVVYLERKSTLFNLPTYFISLFSLPASVANRIEKMLYVQKEPRVCGSSSSLL
jgi:hypothetical protein